MPPPEFYPVDTDTASRDLVSVIVPAKLFLTNWRGASDLSTLTALGVTHVAAVGDEFVDDELDGMVFYKKSISDDDDQAEKMGRSLREAADFLDGAISGGGAAVVHCAAGASRSATVVLAYLVLHSGLPLRQAFGQVWASRPCSWPNDGFMAALIELERAARGEASITIEEYTEWGDYEGPADGEAPSSLPALPRLQRMPTNLGDEIAKVAQLSANVQDAGDRLMEQAGIEAGSGGEAGAAPPFVRLGSSSDLSEGSLGRSGRAAQATRASSEARLFRQQSKASSLGGGRVGGLLECAVDGEGRIAVSYSYAN